MSLQHDEAMALHNPYMRRDGFPSKRISRIDCSKFDPSHKFVRGRKAIWLNMPTDAWLELMASSQTVTALNLWKPKLTRLTSLMHKPLEHLSLSHGNRIVDWSPIRSLQTLKHLSVQWTDRFDIEVVSDLPNLEVLSVGGDGYRNVEVEDSAPIVGLKNLRVLSLAPAQVAKVDAKFLRAIDRLDYFNCSQSILTKVERARKRLST